MGIVAFPIQCRLLLFSKYFQSILKIFIKYFCVSWVTTIYKNCNSYTPVMNLLREYFPLILHNCYITLIINPVTTPVLITHQDPHKPNTTYKYILLERRLSSFTVAPQIFVFQTVLQL